MEATVAPADDSDDTADNGDWTAAITFAIVDDTSTPDGSTDVSGEADEKDAEDDGYGESNIGAAVEDRLLPAPLVADCTAPITFATPIARSSPDGSTDGSTLDERDEAGPVNDEAVAGYGVVKEGTVGDEGEDDEAALVSD